MCGLVGVAGNISLAIKDAFTELLLVDVVRGAHSTGVAAIKREDDTVLLQKNPIPSPLFIGTQEYKDVINTINLKTIIGHNRFATVGAKTVENAHPFQFPNIVGAHNGTLDKWALRQLEAADKFGTDSEALYHNIDLHGVKKAISSVSGAWALTYFDKTDNTINLLRNKERPLYYTYTADRETLFWASESYMLDWILVRNRIKILEGKIYECNPNQHYKWAVPRSALLRFEKPLCMEVMGHVYSKYSGAYNDLPWYDVGQYTTYKTYPDKSPTLPVVIKGRPAKIDTNKFRPPYKDAYGKVLNKHAFNELVKNGCVFCDQTDSVWGDFIMPMKNDMDGRKLYLCQACYDDDDIRELVSNAL